MQERCAEKVVSAPPVAVQAQLRTDLLRGQCEVAGPPRKVPLNSCTSVAPPWRVVCDWRDKCPATACKGSGRGYARLLAVH